MNRANVLGLCSAAPLARQNHRQRCARKPAPAVQGEGSRWRQPIGQNREGLPARFTDSAPHPDGFVLIVVVLTQSPPVADDRVITANRASPREKVQRDHPESALPSASGSAIKRITAGVRAAADRRCQVSIWAGLHPPGKVSLERKKNTAFRVSPRAPSFRTLAGYKRRC